MADWDPRHDPGYPVTRQTDLFGGRADPLPKVPPPDPHAWQHLDHEGYRWRWRYYPARDPDGTMDAPAPVEEAFHLERHQGGRWVAIRFNVRRNELWTILRERNDV